MVYEIVIAFIYLFFRITEDKTEEPQDKSPAQKELK